MKITRLLDPVPAPGGGGTTAPVAPATVAVTTNAMTPQEPPEDNFLDDTVPPAVVPPIETPVPGSVVVDPAAPIVPAAPVTYSPEQVAELMKRNAAPALPVPNAAPVVPLTQDQIDERLNTYKPTEADVNELLEGGPKALGAMGRIAQALVKNAVTVAGVLADDRYNKLMAQLNPHIEFAQQQQQVFAQQQYFTDNPTHVGLEPLVAQVAQQMQGEKFKGTPTETFKEVGKRVDALVARLKIPVTQPAANGTVPSAPAVQPANTRMSTVSTGGQGGAGGAGSGKPADPEANIWN